MPILLFSGTVNGDPDPVYDIVGRVDSTTGSIRAGSYSISSDNLSALGYNVVGGGSGTLLVEPQKFSARWTDRVRQGL